MPERIVLWTLLPYLVACSEAPEQATSAVEAATAEVAAAAEPQAEAEPKALTVDDLPPGKTPAQIHGREVFTNNKCVKCHVEGLGEAPLVTDAKAWAPRVAQPRETLYKHAIEGFWGDIDEMPARGDNPDLTDEEVKHAVDYVLSIHGK